MTGNHASTKPSNREISDLSLQQLGTDFCQMRLIRPELVKSMEHSLSKFGQLSPIIVRKGKRDFQIIDGFKRLYAAESLGWGSLRATLLEITRRAATVMILTYNKNNHSLTDYEEALVLLSLKQQHQMQHEEIAELIGYSPSWVSRRLALVEKLDPAVQDDLKLGVISSTQAREIAHLPRGNQPEVTQTLIEHDLNTRQSAVIVDTFLKTADREQQKYILDHPHEVLERDMHATEDDYDARLSERGNRLLRAIKSAHRQMNRLLDETDRAARGTFTSIEWLILAPELSGASQGAKQLSEFIEAMLEQKSHARPSH